MHVQLKCCSLLNVVWRAGSKENEVKTSRLDPNDNRALHEDDDALNGLDHLVAILGRVTWGPPLCDASVYNDPLVTPALL